MFPYDDFEDDLEVETESEEVSVPQDYGINFTRNVLTGTQVEGLDALKIWARNALLTPRGRYEIFTDDYGSDLEDLIGRAFTPAYVAAEAKRMVEECLTVHPNITGIDNFTANVKGDQLTVSFSLVTDYGDSDMEVEVI